MAYLDVAWSQAIAVCAMLEPLAWLFILRRSGPGRTSGVLGIAPLLGMMSLGVPLLFHLVALG